MGTNHTNIVQHTSVFWTSMAFHHNGLWHLRERLSCDAVCLWIIHRLQQTGPLMAHHFSPGSLAYRWKKSMISHIWQLFSLWLTISPSIISTSTGPAVVLTILFHTVEMLCSAVCKGAFACPQTHVLRISFLHHVPAVFSHCCHPVKKS